MPIGEGTGGGYMYLLRFGAEATVSFPHTLFGEKKGGGALPPNGSLSHYF